MVKVVVANSAAGIPHPDDPSLRIQQVAVVTADGIAGAGQVVTDSTWQHSFNLGSLPSVPTYDGSGNMTSVTYGPDAAGRSIRKTISWTAGAWAGSTGWVLV